MAGDRPITAGAPDALSSSALRVQVHEAGMQRISGASLAQIGISRIASDPARLQLHHGVQEVALQLIGAEDGRLDVGDEIGFSAPDPGDRWNEADTYWLTVADAPGRGMERRDSGPGSTPQRTTGQPAGSWQPHRILPNH